jgi:hypothetical protein
MAMVTDAEILWSAFSCSYTMCVSHSCLVIPVRPRRALSAGGNAFKNPWGMTVGNFMGCKWPDMATLPLNLVTNLLSLLPLSSL